MFDTQNCLKENDLINQSLKPFYEAFKRNDHIEEDTISDKDIYFNKKRENENNKVVIKCTNQDSIVGQAKKNKKRTKKSINISSEKTADSSEENEIEKKKQESNELNNELNFNNKKSDLKENTEKIEVNNDYSKNEKHNINEQKDKNNEDNKFKNIDNNEVNNNDSNEKKLLRIKRKRNKKKVENTSFAISNNNIKKIRILVLKGTIIFINKIIKIKYNIIDHTYTNKQFLKINKKDLYNSRVLFDAKFLDKRLKEILSMDISHKYTNYLPNKNRELVDELLNDSENGEFFKDLLNLSFLDCLEHIRGTKFFENLEGLMTLEEMLNYEDFKIDKKDIENIKNGILNYENCVREKKPRRRSKAAENIKNEDEI